LWRLLGWLVVLVFVLVIVLPTVVVRGCSMAPDRTIDEAGLTVHLWRSDLGCVQELPLEEYVKGVVAAEMPAAFPLEALKAQAVVARTYVIRRLRILGGAGCPEHPQADISDQPSEGQAWLSKEALRERWGGMIAFYRYWGKISEAVEKTAGLYCTYDGLPVDPVYHSTSGGYTESAAAVWGRDVPYLQAVASPHEQDSPRLFESVEFAWEELRRRLGIPADDGDPTAPLELQVLSRSETGRVLELRVGEAEFTGTEFRRLLGLNSTLFSWEAIPGGLRISTTGYGHGVGMSQYGARGMALQGYDFRAIIAHYYQGVAIEPLFKD
jgi:stage II sporulation protein D